MQAEVARTGRTPKEVQDEACAILTNMAHDFNLTHVRGIGYGIIKVVKVRQQKQSVSFIALENLRRHLR